ncbi:hypothetical protein DFJ73DRAFT_859325 [Zopfochytrium polystomum]|nr:hypothetical protein DFJ73DRAFT_859325 [Zopfochytrium polystomum]
MDRSVCGLLVYPFLRQFLIPASWTFMLCLRSFTLSALLCSLQSFEVTVSECVCAPNDKIQAHPCNGVAAITGRAPEKEQLETQNVGRNSTASAKRA